MGNFNREWRRKIVNGSAAFLMSMGLVFYGILPVDAENVPRPVVCKANGNVGTSAKAMTQGKRQFKNNGISRSLEASWHWPIKGITSSDYGWRNGDFHHGLDIATPSGSLIKAALAGKVIKTGWLGVYGLVVLLDHGNGVQTLYAHNSRILVKAGDLVEGGEGISISGSTGKSTGPHLHFEIRCNGKTVNPESYLPKIQLGTTTDISKPKVLTREMGS